MPSQFRPPSPPSLASPRPSSALQRVKELSDEITRHTAEHALADGRNLAADIGFVAVLEARAAAGLGSQAHEARSRSEAQCPEGLAHEAHGAFFLLVVHLDLRV